MNKRRRQELRILIQKIQTILVTEGDITSDEIIDVIQELAGELYNVLDEEMMCRDNIPENLQYSERYEKSDEACDNMEEAYDLLDSVEIGDTEEYIIDSLKKAITYIYSACV